MSSSLTEHHKIDMISQTPYINICKTMFFIANACRKDFLISFIPDNILLLDQTEECL